MGAVDTGVAYGCVGVTPSDSADLTVFARALYIGVGGNIKLTPVRGGAVTFTYVSGGSILPVATQRVWSTDTTASGIIALI